jgi:hypothetical protein
MWQRMRLDSARDLLECTVVAVPDGVGQRYIADLVRHVGMTRALSGLRLIVYSTAVDANPKVNASNVSTAWRFAGYPISNDDVDRLSPVDVLHRAMARNGATSVAAALLSTALIVSSGAGRRGGGKAPNVVFLVSRSEPFARDEVIADTVVRLLGGEVMVDPSAASVWSVVAAPRTTVIVTFGADVRRYLSMVPHRGAAFRAVILCPPAAHDLCRPGVNASGKPYFVSHGGLTLNLPQPAEVLYLLTPRVFHGSSSLVTAVRSASRVPSTAMLAEMVWQRQRPEDVESQRVQRCNALMREGTRCSS